MQGVPVIAIFDIGRTNKKLFLFDEEYKIVYEQNAQLADTTDEDGYPCESLKAIEEFVNSSLTIIFSNKQYDIRAVNFSTHGAGFVYIDESGRPLTPLYNYLKPYPHALKYKFYNTYGGEENFSRETASPVLDSLNSGMQLYRIKQEKPSVFAAMKYALHLPQYLVYIVTKKTLTEITSIGCHTNLWNFEKNDYHDWVRQEAVLPKFPPIVACDHAGIEVFNGHEYRMGTGLHDSSAAVIPYLINFREPFVLISTGTWCISLNPFNHDPLTMEQLKRDCLCFLHYKGLPVKASRLFAGHEHEEQVKKIAAHFHLQPTWFEEISFDPNIVQRCKPALFENNDDRSSPPQIAQVDPNNFVSPTEAYHQLMINIIQAQYHSAMLVMNDSSLKNIYVDGGFSRNKLYMNLLASVFPGCKVYAASVANASAMGAALAIASSWNTRPLPPNIIELIHYPPL